MTSRVGRRRRKVEAERALVVYTREMLASAREELVRADGKAALLLAAAGVAIGATMGGLIAREWTPFVLANCVEWIWWAGAGAAALALGNLGAAVYPRTRRRGSHPKVVAYFADVNRLADRPAELRSALRDSAAREDQRLVDQLVQISHFVQLKYTRIGRAMVALAAAAVLCVFAVLADGRVC